MKETTSTRAKRECRLKSAEVVKVKGEKVEGRVKSIDQGVATFCIHDEQGLPTDESRQVSCEQLQILSHVRSRPLLIPLEGEYDAVDGIIEATLFFDKGLREEKWDRMNLGSGILRFAADTGYFNLNKKGWYLFSRGEIEVELDPASLVVRGLIAREKTGVIGGNWYQLLSIFECPFTRSKIPPREGDANA